MRVRERVEQFGHDAGHLAQREPAPCRDRLVQRMAFHQFHRDERGVAILSVLEHLHDVRVQQPPGRLRLTPEAVERGRLFVDRQRGPADRLDGYCAFDRGVVAAVDHAHAAASDDRIDPVLTDARWQCHAAAACGNLPSAAAGAPARGSRMLNVVPRPGRDATSMRPPCWAMIL